MERASPWPIRSFAGLGIGIALVIGSLAGCGDDDSDSPSSGSPGACQRACAVCTSDPCADCATAAERFRPEVGGAMFECVASGSCAPSLWASCLTGAIGGVSRRSIDDRYRDACNTKRQQCIAEGTSFADDDCLLSHMLSEAWVAKAEACLATGCPETRDCLGAIFY